MMIMNLPVTRCSLRLGILPMRCIMLASGCSAFPNNHSYDKGAGGIASSMAHWAAMPDDVVSMGFYNLETYDDYVHQTVNGVTIGYLSYTERPTACQRHPAVNTAWFIWTRGM